MTVTSGLQHRLEQHNKDRPRPRVIRLTNSLVAVGVLWLAFLVLGRIAPMFSVGALASSWLNLGTFAFSVALVSTIISVQWRFLVRMLIAPPFAVALLGALLMGTVLGTFIIQGQPAAVYAERYGALAKILLALGLDDIFHSFWFNGYLVVLSVSMAMVVIKRRAWRAPQWGFLLSHTGVVLILVGGLVGNIFGYKAHIDLHVGNTTGEAIAFNRTEQTTSSYELGFEVRLEDFQIERYDPEYRFYVYRQAGSQYEVVRSFGVEEAAEWQRINESDSFRVTRTLDHRPGNTHLGNTDERGGAPLLQIRGSHEDGEPRILAAGVEGTDSLVTQDGMSRVRLISGTLSDAQIANRLAPNEEASHVISFQKDDCCPADEVIVTPNGSYTLGDGKIELKVLKYLPDFIYDTKAREAATRSDQPINPALQVEYSAAGSKTSVTQWLFARMPDYGAQHGKKDAGPKIVYQYRQGSAVLPTEVLVTTDGDIRVFNHGKLAARASLDSTGRVPGLPSLALKLVAPPDAASQKSKDSPVRVEVEIKDTAGSRTVVMSAQHSGALQLSDESMMVFEPKPNDVKAYSSVVSVIEGGEKVREQTVKVNEPLVHNGIHIYQTSFRADDPDYSGFQVVKDPGLPMVWTGFSTISLGVIFAFYVRPVLLDRRRRKGAKRV